MIKRTVKKEIVAKEKRGFALLFAVLTASVLVALGISIFNISLKELQIATTEQDSQQAYYAADSAEECALYWDIKQGSFPACLGDDTNGNCNNTSTSTTNTILCNGRPVALNFAQNNNIYTYGTTTFLRYASSSADIVNPEAAISITKTYYPANGSAPAYIATQVIAEGHNTAIIGRRIERGVSQAYNSQ